MFCDVNKASGVGIHNGGVFIASVKRKGFSCGGAIAEGHWHSRPEKAAGFVSIVIYSD